MDIAFKTRHLSVKPFHKIGMPHQLNSHGPSKLGQVTNFHSEYLRMLIYAGDGWIT